MNFHVELSAEHELVIGFNVRLTATKINILIILLRNLNSAIKFLRKKNI